MHTVELYEFFKQSEGVSIDSRSINTGDLFFAIKGPNFDGHNYISVAFENGASYAIIDDPTFKDLENVVLVKNVIKALQNLARFYRCMLNIPIIGITGSNGKTTTKELIASVLKTKYSVFATKGNLNNHLGVPISILSIKDHHKIAIIEMGASHIGEIKFLSELSMPDLGLITNVGKAHLEGFGDLEGVRTGKSELYDYLDKIKGTIFYNTDDVMLTKSLPPNTSNIGYSISCASSVSNYPFVEFQHNNYFIQSNLSGFYNLTNIFAALSLGIYFNLNQEKLKKGIENYIPNNNRSQIIKTQKNVLIMDSYNANPSSMEVSIMNFQSHPSSKKSLILGHMLELGGSSKVEHEKLVNLILSYDWDNVFLVGAEFLKLDIKLPFEVYRDTSEFINKLKEINLKNHTILLKGSRGVALEKCVEYL